MNMHAKATMTVMYTVHVQNAVPRKDRVTERVSKIIQKQ